MSWKINEAYGTAILGAGATAVVSLGSVTGSSWIGLTLFSQNTSVLSAGGVSSSATPGLQMIGVQSVNPNVAFVIGTVASTGLTGSYAVFWLVANYK